MAILGVFFGFCFLYLTSLLYMEDSYNLVLGALCAYTRGWVLVAVSRLQELGYTFFLHLQQTKWQLQVFNASETYHQHSLEHVYVVSFWSFCPLSPWIIIEFKKCLVQSWLSSNPKYQNSMSYLCLLDSSKWQYRSAS